MSNRWLRNNLVAVLSWLAVVALFLISFAICSCTAFSHTSVDPATATAARQETPTAVTTGENTETTSVEISTAPTAPSEEPRPLVTVESRAATPGGSDVVVSAGQPQYGPIARHGQTYLLDGRAYQIPELPGGTKVVIHREVRGRTAEAHSVVNATSSGRGNGVSAWGATVDMEKVQAPGADAGDGTSASGGSMAVSSKLFKASRGAMILYVIGGLILIAGIVIGVWLKLWKLGGGLIAGGALAIGAGVVIEAYPWVVLALLAAAIGGAIWFVLYARTHGGLAAALKAIVSGVESVSDTSASEVKAAVSAAATAAGTSDAVKAAVTQVKAALPS